MSHSPPPGRAPPACQTHEVPGADPVWLERRARLAAFEACPPREADADGRCSVATLLDQVGRTEAAKAAYLAIVADHPTHATTLNALGALLYRTGYRSAARTVFSQAVQCHKEDPAAQVNLANLLRQSGETAAARSGFEAALRVAPDFAQAHQGLGDLLAELGDIAGAQHHWRLGYRGHAVHAWTYRGRTPPVRVLMPISVANGNIAARVFLDDHLLAVTTVAMEFYDPAAPLPRHDLVLNAIGDADLCRGALVSACALVARTPAPVINAPERVLRTGRLEMARLLCGLDGIEVPRMAVLSRLDLAGAEGAALLKRHGFSFPVLLRTLGFHTGRHFLLVEEAGALSGAAASLPGKDVLAIAFHASGWADGCARKGRVMVIDGRLYPLHWAVSRDWKVHYFTADMAEHAAYRAEEARFLADMRGFLGETAIDGLRAVAERLGLDYGGIDFGLLADGRVLIFEANATMAIVPPPVEHMWQYRRPASDLALLAARSMLHRRNGSTRT